MEAVSKAKKANRKDSPPKWFMSGGSRDEGDTSNLKRLVSAYAPHDGGFDLRIPGVRALRYSRINKECVHALGLPSLCIATQGAKTIIVGQEVYEYDASRVLVLSVALPVVAQVMKANFTEPKSPRPSPIKSTAGLAISSP